MKRISLMLIVGVLLLYGAAPLAAGPLKPVTNFPLTGIGYRAHDIAIQNDPSVPGRLVAYVATDDGLTIVDITDPAAPSRLGYIDLGGETMGVTVKGRFAFLANTATDFNVVDVLHSETPTLVASRRVAGSAYDVAVKDNSDPLFPFVAYVVSFAGEMYVYKISSTGMPTTNPKVLGLIAWTNAGSDTANITKMKNGTSAGSGKATGVSVTGDTLLAVEANYGRMYYWDVSQAPDNPVFKGTHYAPFTFRVESNPSQTVAYNLATYGAYSGVYSVNLDALEQLVSTRYTTCQPPNGTICDYSRGPNTDYGGLAVSPNGKYVVYISGKKGYVTVLNTGNQTDPETMTIADQLAIPNHGIKTLEAMGVAIAKCDYIFTAAGVLGVGVFKFPGLSAGSAGCP